MPYTKHRRRDQLSITAAILNIAKRGALKTQIMYKANLSFSQLKDYLPALLANDLMTQDWSDGKELYYITGKGIDFLRRHRELSCMMHMKARSKDQLQRHDLLTMSG